jgi:Tol biopolymer transport system component
VPAIDERLRSDLRRVARPADPTGVFEDLAERRGRRAVGRRVGHAALSLIVLVATAGGFLALRSAFETPPNVAEPSPVPRNGLIVFERRGSDDRSHLYTMRPDGTDVRQLTDFRTNDGQPAVSPDGRTVAFAHELDDHGPVIGSIPIDGGVVSWLTDEGLFVTGAPSWSPDGTRIAFPAHDRGGQRLYVMNANGTGQRALTGDDLHWVDSAAWSPDGSVIAFTASPLSGEDDPSVWDVYTIRPDGTGLTNVTSTPEIDEGAPTWSPDGERIAYSIASGRGSSIVALRVADGSITTITDGDHLDTSPAWSPDGTLIAFERARADGGDYDVWTMRPDGSGATRLTTGGGLSPAWQRLPPGTSPSAVKAASLS